MELLDYEKEHVDILRKYLSECVVLLKSDGSFPLDKSCSIAAFGNGVRNTIKGGTGSGEVNSRYFVTVEEALKNEGFDIVSTSWLDEYDVQRKEARKVYLKNIKKEARKSHENYFFYAMGKTMNEPDYDIPLEYEADAAIYVLTRISGEGTDRNEEKGDIRLNDSEIRDIKYLNDKFKRFMLILNVGGPVDLSEISEVRNILLLSQLGVETGYALTDVLLGKTNPSGKLATTWAKYDLYPCRDDFDDQDETRYKEGIYVGYRYFDSKDLDVLFPFGFGLSYTEFKYEVKDIKNNKDQINIRVLVKNIGKLPGKEVIQLYLSKPSKKLVEPYQELCAFKKTKLLLPNEEEVLELSFNLSDMASYDASIASYILESGGYLLRLGNSSRNNEPILRILIDEDVTILKAKNVFGNPRFEDLNIFVKEDIFTDIKSINLTKNDFVSKEVIYGHDYEILDEVNSFSKEELCLINLGKFDPSKKGLMSFVGNSANKVLGAAGQSVSSFDSIPVMAMSDGPAGIRITRDYFIDKKGPQPIQSTVVPDSILELMPGFLRFLVKLFTSKKAKKGVEIKHQYCTAIPIGTALAQSFNVDFVKTCGDIIGDEMERFNIQLWLAPALNIHRSIRCGRNFEYYSEDPLVTGLIGANITNGVQAHKNCGVTIKHFAANNKETNRFHNSSNVSERALREIYLKAFKIVVKEASPTAVMTSYNLINGVHTGEHRGLIEDVLRSEYLFNGIVMTDWIVKLGKDEGYKYDTTRIKGVVNAGGDLFMPGSIMDYTELIEAVNKGEIDINQLKINASRVIKMAKYLNR